MTRYILLVATAALTFVQAGAQDMNEALKKAFISFDTTREVSAKTAQANKLALIAKKWKDEWAPHYYNAYAKASLSFMLPEDEMDKKDAMLDEADASLDEAVTLLGKENDDIYVMRAMLAQARMAVDGRNRWQKYGKLFDENLQKAKELNAENPRIYYLKGTSVFFTPKMFGGGGKKALEYFEKAQPLFVKEEDGNMSDPYWGAEANEYFIQLCKNEKEDTAGEGSEKK